MNGWRRTVEGLGRGQGHEPQYLSIDQGTTSTRALIFDENRRVLASAQQEFAQHYPADGWSMMPRISGATRWPRPGRAGEGRADRRGHCRHRHHQPARNGGAVGPRDGRAAAPRDCVAGPAHRGCLRPLRAQGLEPLVQERTGLLLDPYFSGTKLAWLLDTIPGARERAEKGELAFGTIDTFLLWRLTEGVSTRPM
jgi:glycerol kinase